MTCEPGEGLLYETIHRRRDTRGEFTGEPIPTEMLHRVLGAAHAAPSVGLSQPWDFVVVSDRDVRKRFREHVHTERQVFADRLDAERARVFSRIKIEGIEESSVGIVVGYDPSRGAPAVLGRHAIADAGLYSVCLAIQNLWLAATAEGLGLGWVSFYREEFLRELVGLPENVRPVAWLCVGPVRDLPAVPDLERHGWRDRLPLSAVLHYERYAHQPWSSIPGPKTS
ncbi:5,6-dimethylbenzimidazole synthase [Amycolatopsis alba]|uniref:5,6-dimethylbenzimidazole synthase n=1 Tax=Amycolatopsis alba DSM 44262 TaxID=1125972 RepID=A0A229RFP0_AMYAL|nr:5,6-dimethylbenzimidazole synthase [Amycolatopsis alba]OXM45467.1 5,6-dimethylbenzimidazole synthase [Amycolatopsis alba DSM 44262]